ncbi:hypothetical protein D3C86_1196300 [compost metagenome]
MGNMPIRACSLDLCEIDIEIVGALADGGGCQRFMVQFGCGRRWRFLGLSCRRLGFNGWRRVCHIGRRFRHLDGCFRFRHAAIGRDGCDIGFNAQERRLHRHGVSNRHGEPGDHARHG